MSVVVAAPQTPIAKSDLDIKLRKDHRIVVKISEGKNLPTDAQDAHCVIRIDDQVATQVKTKTVWRNRNPFWDEEYEFTLSNSFKQVIGTLYSSFYPLLISLFDTVCSRGVEQEQVYA